MIGDADRSMAHLRQLVAGRSHAARGGAIPEGTADEAGPPGAAEVVGHVEATLDEIQRQAPPDEVGDPQEFRRARDVLLHEAHRTLRRLDADPQTDLAPHEAVAIEAVILTDGTRPTLVVRDDEVDAHHPMASTWSMTLDATRDALRDVVRAIGRIEPARPSARDYFGTGWVVDAEAGRVLTNLHVLEAMWRRLPHLMEPTRAGFRVHDGVFIDFVRESGSRRSNRFRVVEAVPSGVDGPGYARLDAAVLKIEPTTSGQEVPAAVPVSADADGPLGNLDSFCAVGFPAAPPVMYGVHEDVDWSWVTGTLFGNRFGIKRLAPGTAHRPLGSFPDDDRPWVFGHDLTTLRGSSGSPILAWRDDPPAAFGLHFAGLSLETNCAHAVAECVDELAALGVPI